jgi:hypothetical protein
MAVIARTEADARPVNDYDSIEVTMDELVQAGELVYIKSNGKGAVANASAAGTMKARGVATMSTAIGRAVALVTRGKITGYAGMTPGADVHVSNTAGEFDTVAGTVPQIAGYAMSATDIYVEL